MHKIMITYPLFDDAMRILESSSDLFVTNSGDLTPFLDELQAASGFITRNVHPTTGMLRNCPNLRVIGIPGVGYQNYDIDFLTQHGIVIIICPGMNTRAVAEHALCLAYTLTKNIVETCLEVKNGNYNIRNRFNNFELFGCLVGIAGFGQIGRATARLFHAHDMNICVYDPFVSRDAVESYGYRYCSALEELAEISDIISLHMPSLESTKGLFNDSIFSRMKKGAYFINCARGSVVDEDALYDALISGKIAGAGLDVMVSEPFDLTNPLLKLPNVVVTPHVAGVTRQSANRIHTLVVENSLSLLNGHSIDPEYVVNPDAFQHPKWKKFLPWKS